MSATKLFFFFFPILSKEGFLLNLCFVVLEQSWEQQQMKIKVEKAKDRKMAYHFMSYLNHKCCLILKNKNNTFLEITGLLIANLCVCVCVRACVFGVCMCVCCVCVCVCVCVCMCVCVCVCVCVCLCECGMVLKWYKLIKLYTKERQKL